MILIMSLIVVFLVSSVIVTCLLYMYRLCLDIHVNRLRYRYLKNEGDSLQRETDHYGRNVILLENGYFEKQIAEGISTDKVFRRWEVDRQYVEM